MRPSVEELRAILRTTLAIRRFEEAFVGYIDRHEFPGHGHVAIGQEATAAAVCALLGPDDYLVTTHRNHGHNLARGADPGRMLAEVLGRADGYCGGKSGTFHITPADLGVLSATGIVGGGIPTAAGIALAIKRRGGAQVAVGFFGEGAVTEGSFHEAVNLAALWSLPVVFVCENNDTNALQLHNAGLPVGDIAQMVGAHGLPSVAVDGTAAAAVYETVGEAVRRARAGGGPTFVEARTGRWPGNETRWPQLVMGATELRRAWEPLEPSEPYAEWYAADPVLRLAHDLLDADALTFDELLAMDEDALREVARADRFAHESPLPDPAQAFEDVYA